MDTDSGLLWSNGLSDRLLHEPSRKRRREEGGSRGGGLRESRRRCDVRGCLPRAGCAACVRRSGLRTVNPAWAWALRWSGRLCRRGWDLSTWTGAASCDSSGFVPEWVWRSRPFTDIYIYILNSIPSLFTFVKVLEERFARNSFLSFVYILTA